MYEKRDSAAACSPSFRASPMPTIRERARELDVYGAGWHRACEPEPEDAGWRRACGCHHPEYKLVSLNVVFKFFDNVRFLRFWALLCAKFSILFDLFGPLQISNFLRICDLGFYKTRLMTNQFIFESIEHYRKFCTDYCRFWQNPNIIAIFAHLPASKAARSSLLWTPAHAAWKGCCSRAKARLLSLCV